MAEHRRFVRFFHRRRWQYGLLLDGEVAPLAGSMYGSPERKGDSLPLDEVRLGAPCRPSKIVAIGVNYRGHAKEMGHPLPPEPKIFLKPSTAVIGPGDEICLPAMSSRVDYEAELGVVIRRRAKRVSKEAALDYVLGYTCFNDVTARDLQKKDGQWARAKSFDTFAPVGPVVVAGLDPGDLLVESYLNGERRQGASTAELIFGVPTLISFISHVMTLLPGDIIATGTPSGIGPMVSGDTVEIRVEGVGILENRVGPVAE